MTTLLTFMPLIVITLATIFVGFLIFDARKHGELEDHPKTHKAKK